MDLRGKRIFIVEDNLDNRMVLRIALTKRGAFVDFEAWGMQTMHKLKSFAPVDLILLDLMLAKGISGYKIFDEIRAVPAFAEVPIVAVSAAEPSEAIARCMAQGFDGFIAKPINSTLFAEQLGKVLDGEKVWFGAGINT